MNSWLKYAAAFALLVGVLAGGYFFLRGPTGASTLYGGDVEATLVPEFLRLDDAHWVNGKPTKLASLKGKPVLIEAWGPA